MGKQGKSKSNGLGDRVRPAPYKKPTVEVRFEGEPSAATTKAKSSSAPAPAAVATAKPKPAKADAALPVKSEKAKGKERASPPTSTNVPGSFIVIAGSYEKLLYGIEGSYPTPEGQEDDGQVNKTVRPDFTPIFIFPAHLAFVKAIAASPGGKWLATGSEDEFIKVWDLRRRKEVGSLSQHTGEFGLCLFADSLTVAKGSEADANSKDPSHRSTSRPLRISCLLRSTGRSRSSGHPIGRCSRA